MRRKDANKLWPKRFTLVEPLACCLRAFSRSPIMPGDIVAIIGAGTAGLLHVQLARFYGAGKIVSVDLIPQRLEKALSLGADFAVDASKEDPVAAVRNATKGAGADLVITAVGKASVVEQALTMARDGGRVNIFAECPPDSRISLDPNLMYQREVALLGTYSSSPFAFTDALQLIESGRVHVQELITHRMPLHRVQEAFDLAMEGQDCLKIVINPSR